jgi:hypothetical protein
LWQLLRKGKGRITGRGFNKIYHFVANDIFEGGLEAKTSSDRFGCLALRDSDFMRFVGNSSSHPSTIGAYGRLRCQQLAQFRPTPPARDVADRDGDGLLLSNQNDKPLAAGNASVEKIPLQHGVVLRHDRDH